MSQSRKNIEKMLMNQVSGLKSRFVLMNQTTKNLVFLLLAAVVFSFVLNKIYKPKQLKIYRLEQEVSSLENKIIKAKGDLPDIVQEENRLNQDKKSLAALGEQLAVLERQLPQQDSLSDLLGRLVKQSEGYDLDFKLIKPLEDEEDRAYDRLNIEMRFASNFISVVNYLRRLETIFEFLTTESVLVKKNEDLLKSDLEVTMYLSTLLADSSERTKFRSKINLVSDFAQIMPERDPYQSIELKQKIEEEEERVYVLSGIVLRGKQPTVIIDNEVYKVGDWIDKAQIKTISREGVVLQRGEKEFLLTILEEDKKEEK